MNNEPVSAEEADLKVTMNSIGGFWRGYTWVWSLDRKVGDSWYHINDGEAFTRRKAYRQIYVALDSFEKAVDHLVTVSEMEGKLV